MTRRSSSSLSRGNGSSKAPRVLVLATDLSTGGGVNRVLTNLAGLFAQQLDFDTTLVSARSSAPAEYSVSRCVKRRQYQRGGLWHYLRTLWQLRREKFDFAIGPWTQDNLLLTLVFLGCGTKTVLMEHAQWKFHMWPVRLGRRLIYPLAWRVCALNPLEFNYYTRFLSNVVLMPNPVPTISGLERCRERLILAVGHLTPLKNFADTIRAVALSGVERQGWSLTIIGDGPEREQLLSLIRELGLAATTIERPTGDLQERYAKASLLLHTSLMEVFPMVLAESMAAGVVPIAYDADGRSFILEDFPENLVPFGNIEEMAARIRYFASKELASLRGQVRRSIEDRFSLSVTGERWRRVLTCST